MKLGQKSSFFLIASLLVLSFGVQAQTETYRARLSPMPTNPQTVATIIGEGEVILTLSGNTLSVQGSFEGMSSAATAAHVHNGPPAQPGPVVQTLTISTMSSGEISGVLELSNEQVTALRNNELYIQVHSEGNPPGELRGWIFLRS